MLRMRKYYCLYPVIHEERHLRSLECIWGWKLWNSRESKVIAKFL